jgi:hypothetical protein
MSPSALINYYARSTLYKHVQNVCNDGLARSTSNPSFLLWRAYGLAMEGSSADVSHNDQQPITHTCAVHAHITILNILFIFLMSRRMTRLDECCRRCESCKACSTTQM